MTEMQPEFARGWLRSAILPWRENARLRRWISSIGNADFEQARGANETILQLSHIIRAGLPASAKAYAAIGTLIEKQGVALSAESNLRRRELLLASKPRPIRKRHYR
jgi:hypothetical protein